MISNAFMNDKDTKKFESMHPYHSKLCGQLKNYFVN